MPHKRGYEEIRNPRPSRASRKKTPGGAPVIRREFHVYTEEELKRIDARDAWQRRQLAAEGETYWKKVIHNRHGAYLKAGFTEQEISDGGLDNISIHKEGTRLMLKERRAIVRKFAAEEREKDKKKPPAKRRNADAIRAAAIKRAVLDADKRKKRRFGNSRVSIIRLYYEDTGRRR